MKEFPANSAPEIIRSVCGIPHESTCSWLPPYNGLLKIFPDRMEFHGRSGMLEVRDVWRISYGARPGGFSHISGWVKVEHGAGQVLYLLDSRWLGWRGIFGGTLRLFRRLRAAFPGQTDA